ncbi:MAG: glucans biosynthesis glucosyltransferase MdoH [Alphaproteobacteria bacterium]|nr:glucans biosynthesis glucosyltransferase MdoH [Alphaproteobacteria bacterium]
MTMSPTADDARRDSRNRALLFGLVLVTTLLGTLGLSVILGANGLTWLEAALIAPFVVTFSGLALSFWTAMIGLALTVAGRSDAAPRRGGAQANGSRPLTSRVAIVMPIYNEDPDSVFAGLAAVIRSLAATGQLAAFDFFVLSDSTDGDVIRAENVAWRALRARRPECDGVFYRHRPKNVARKAGNIADWVRCWGDGYACMVVLDADSLMEGETLVRLAAAMEDDPRIGILQTVPIPVGRCTVFARALQFTASFYSRIFAVGSAFWQLGEAPYYGHNAIIRVHAFAAHCGLPDLPGTPPLGGEILSHDFVEAALIRRGGWSVRVLPELTGSYEQLPANLLAFAARERRWAQGNLQHAQIVAARGLHGCSRLNLALGVLSYLVAPLWLLMLVLATAVVVEEAWSGHAYFGAEVSLFPKWPEYRPLETGVLLAATACLLWLPKVLIVAWAIIRRDTRRAFGGAFTLLASAVAEVLLSAVMAPIMMLFHTAFVVQILAGRSVGWPAQPREDQRVAWSLAARRHFAHVVLGLLWAVSVWRWAPHFLVWLAPILVALIASIPFTVLTSRVVARPWLFVTPYEIWPPPILRLAEREHWAAREDASPGAPAEPLGTSACEVEASFAAEGQDVDVNGGGR